MPDSLQQTQLRRENQKLHRAQLRLARLKTKINKARQTDARMKLRLGNLVYLTGWDTMDLAQIEDHIVQIKSRLADKKKRFDFQLKGQIALNRLADNSRKKQKTDPYEQQKPTMSADEWRALNHHKITIGGLFVKHQLGKINRPTLFGALLEKNETMDNLTRSHESEPVKFE